MQEFSNPSRHFNYVDHLAYVDIIASLLEARLGLMFTRD